MPAVESRPRSQTTFPRPPAVHDDLLRLIDLDENTHRDAERLWAILEPDLEQVLTAFYRKVDAIDRGTLVHDGNRDRLKDRQAGHWHRLFTSRFDPAYMNGVRRIGIRHRDLALDPTWYVTSYMVLKHAFAKVVMAAEIEASEKDRLVTALDKYVAVDMSLGISAYLAAIVD